MKFNFILLALLFLWQIGNSQSHQTLLNEPLDISPDFRDWANYYYFADSLASFDPATGQGFLKWNKMEATPGHAFDNTQFSYERAGSNTFPSAEYQTDPMFPFSLEFVSPKTVRLRAWTSLTNPPQEPSLMLVKEPGKDNSWKHTMEGGNHVWRSAYGSVTMQVKPWKVSFYDASGKLLTSTRTGSDTKGYIPNLPFSFIRRAKDYSRSVAAVFNIAPDEHFYGCGESFTRLDKKGQKVVLYTNDGNGVNSANMYKPVPFFLSSRGYGMFMHTSTPITCDFGRQYAENNELLIGDETLDLFVMLGEPKTVLDEYTNLTGKSPMPPLWSFGLWMSRISYFSEADGRKVAADLRQHKIPSDVLHFDTGWFGTDWRCDYQFAKDRFPDPVGMISDLKKMGLHTCLWQLPYFVPKNDLFQEITSKGLAVKSASGGLPYEDAVLDFTNPATIDWYEGKIGGLLKQGVSAIKVDFGEAAPLDGIYHNGHTGFYEHNLYPLRYNKIVSDLTQKINGERIIWARSTWAGSQRYPLHWGGDAESDDMGMESELRGGLSLGLSGFTFWSHDAGGFTRKTPEELYRRWFPMAVLSSHTRCHGQPPKEPWEYGKDFEDYFRKTIEMKYKLMPYVYAQAKESSEKGLPMLRALFVEFPNDPGSWLVDNEYMYGSDILVAPLFEEGTKSRNVYLPPGQWVDFQTKKTYAGGWQTIEAGEIQVIMLVKSGSVLPMVKLAQSTQDIDWGNMELVVYGSPATAKTKICLPSENMLREVTVSKKGKGYAVTQDGSVGKVKWVVR
ncbi:MAG: alpha-xylosidase [Bacteroidetes bacterium]|nr:alpha-xylosidase [Bacteroidota bacterium]